MNVLHLEMSERVMTNLDFDVDLERHQLAKEVHEHLQSYHTYHSIPNADLYTTAVCCALKVVVLAPKEKMCYSPSDSRYAT